MPGLVARLLVVTGQAVAEGTPVIVMEAMKLMYTLVAPRDGIVARLPVAEGTTVARGDGAGRIRGRARRSRLSRTDHERAHMAGLYFEELTPGRAFDHPWSRTVTEMDNVLFSTLTMNVQPLHLDEHFASQTEWGTRIVNSLFTLGLMIGISVNDTTIGTTVGNLGMTDVKFPKPVFHGDTLRVRPRSSTRARAGRSPTSAS